MGNWVYFDVSERWSGPNPKSVASLARNELYIGRLLIEAGFDISRHYWLFFDEDGGRIGLKPMPKGFKCYVSSKNGPRFRVSAFCERFNLKGHYTVDDFTFEDQMWVLPLRKLRCVCGCEIKDPVPQPGQV